MDEIVEEPFSKMDRLKERLKMSLAFCQRYNMSAAVCYLRIHIPPELLTSKNHEVESVLLRKMVARLKNSIRELDTVIKVNGSDFAIFLVDITVHDCKVICERIIRVVSEKYTVDVHQISVGSNMGICMYPYGSEEADELMSFAKVQMYEAERGGENTFSFYNGELDPTAYRQMLIENDLPYALKKGQLSVQYQPQYSLVDKKITGVEALIRWNHPSLGMITPGEFIDHTELAGLVNGLFYWVFEECCKNIASGTDQQVRYSINLSVNQLLLDNFLLETSTILSRYSVPASQITLEITENIEIYTVKSVNETLFALKEMGFTIALDDFGNGYFSFSDFLKLPIDYIKLDRNFVSSLLKNKKHIGVISPIITMAHNLGLQVIIEGIEVEAQFFEWAGLGCDLIQGFFISRPIPFEELTHSIVEIERRIEDGYC
ncbi:phosphodiesterase [Bacillus sp. ISL-18]|uniref:putative bifunctional diguanylate cyclase/phosphodiesterase n=1 Tax=Bacillus sp. ISL-18 TaxID=2819118 RepID=UPI001BE6D8BE|nr:phosphodiesterase [Bacillus sp. ISL-18]MBT2658770.1 phosphodiesterase [Bacillus sp. ISL-18]